MADVYLDFQKHIELHGPIQSDEEND